MTFKASRWLLALPIGIAALVGFHYVTTAPQKAKQATVQATADTNAATGTMQAAKDALQITVQTQAVHGQIDVISKDNDNAIRHAAGATAPVDPDLHATGLRALCVYDVYRGDRTACPVLHADPE